MGTKTYNFKVIDREGHDLGAFYSEICAKEYIDMQEEGDKEDGTYSPGAYKMVEISAEEDTRIRIGDNIKGLRFKKGMTQAQLAKAAGVTTANISRIERGDYSPGLDVLSKIADALDAKVYIV